jgi:hypothetical protein
MSIPGLGKFPVWNLQDVSRVRPVNTMHLKRIHKQAVLKVSITDPHINSRCFKFFNFLTTKLSRYRPEQAIG